MVDAHCNFIVFLCPVMWWQKHTCRKTTALSAPAWQHSKPLRLLSCIAALLTSHAFGAL